MVRRSIELLTQNIIRQALVCNLFFLCLIPEPISLGLCIAFLSWCNYFVRFFSLCPNELYTNLTMS